MATPAFAAETTAAAQTAASETAQELPVVKVSDTADKKEKDGYQATKTRVGKMLQDPQDVPQAVTSVTRKLMDEQQVGSLREALRNVSGLTFNAAEGGRAGDNMMLRGFYTFGDIYLDGIRDTAQYNRETFNLEQVDVLRGSAAMLFGRGQAGGVINQVTKMAKLEDENRITGSLGTYDYRQFTGDFNKQLTETAAIRVNVMDRYEETYRKNPANGDRPSLDREGIAVSFGAGIGTDNELFLNHVYTQTRDVPDYGINFVNGRPINRAVAGGTINDSTFYGGNKNFDNSDTRISTAIFTHKFNDDTQIRTQLRHADYERAYWAKTPSATLLPTDTLGVGGNVTRKMDYETLTLQSDFITKFNLAGMKHQFLTGIEYLKEDSYRQALRNLGTTANPYYTSSQVTGAATKFKADNYALYVQDSIEFIPKWEVLLGVRRDEMRADYSSATSPSLSYGENSYRTGLSWHQNDATHYYLSWSDSFSPTADLYQLTVTPLPPERSKTAELGGKWLFLDGDLSFRTAIYRTTKDWERSTDLESTASVLTKKRRTDGIEFEVAGRVTDNWEVFSGLAFMDAKILEVAENVNANTGVITSADPRFKGQRARNTPPVTFNMWTTYTFAENWKVGGGFEAKGERYGYNPSTTNASAIFPNGEFTPNKLPGYTRWDAMVAYEQPKWAVRLNVKNLFDKEYYDAIYDNGGFSVPGNRRQAILTTELKF
ncbi:TonB-dependent receptor [Methylovorus glucosotrophus]|uniref:TonB-dependent receptor n=1 Tax=Methylovorus glucosotrophus TaxID=266009 RepID=UPI003CC81E56